MLLALSIIIIICGSTEGLTYRPVVLMHGIQSTASDMNDLAGWLRQSFEGIYVISVEIGNGYEDSILLPMNKQVELFCQTIRADPNLQNGFNMVGVSQGSLIVRGAVEKCSLPVYNLITLVGIHQGVFGIPNLQSLPPAIRELVSDFAYEEAVQNIISVAGYWRDPFQMDKYLSKSHFLPVINNEGSQRNETYRLNMLKLNAFVMVYSDMDVVVSPQQTGWFLGFRTNSLVTESWNQSRQYTEDLIGLRTMQEQGKLHYFTCHTPHQESEHAPDKQFFFENILAFFNNTLSN